MTPYDYNPVIVSPTVPAAWCFLCDGLRHFAPPLPPVEQRTTAIGVMTVRTGHCRDCGGELYRVGGGRSAEPSSPEMPTPDVDSDDLFFDDGGGET